MRISQQSVLQYVRSKNVSTNYPGLRMANAGRLQDLLQFAAKLTPEKLIIVCERSATPSIQYVSANCMDVLGHDAKRIAEMPLDEFLLLVHPDDHEGLTRCFAYINSLEPYDPMLYRFELHYRFMTRDGDYRYIRNEKIAVLDDDNRYVHLALFSNVDKQEKFFDVKLHIHKNIHGSYKKISTYNPRNPATRYTSRQKDILLLVTKGLSNQEIADRLNLSVNTIKNHKGVLFRKAKAKNSIELVALAAESGN
jgi:DNA-binding CsgD family transcriptional regulator